MTDEQLAALNDARTAWSVERKLAALAVIEAAIKGPCRHISDLTGRDCPVCVALDAWGALNARKP